jgi:hypothetical protein
MVNLCEVYPMAHFLFIYSQRLHTSRYDSGRLPVGYSLFAEILGEELEIWKRQYDWPKSPNPPHTANHIVP